MVFRTNPLLTIYILKRTLINVKVGDKMNTGCKKVIMVLYSFITYGFIKILTQKSAFKEVIHTFI